MRSRTVNCPNCGIEGQVGDTCFKCDTKLTRSFNGPLYVIDVAHSGEDKEDALRKVIQGIEVSLRNYNKGLKIIHGQSSRSGPATIKNHVLPFLKKEAKRLNAKLVKDKNNPGAHILYF